MRRLRTIIPNMVILFLLGLLFLALRPDPNADFNYFPTYFAGPPPVLTNVRVINAGEYNLEELGFEWLIEEPLPEKPSNEPGPEPNP